MKLLSSNIYDFINKITGFIQLKLNIIRENSIILSSIDYFILLSILILYCVSITAGNGLTAIFAVFVIFLVVLKVIITKGEKIELETCNLYLISYLFICFLSNFTSSLPAQSLYGFSKTLLYFGFYFALCQFLKTNKKFIISLIFVIAVLVSFESIIGLIQNILGVANIATWQDTSYVNPEDILTRVYGTLKPYNPNLFGGWLIAGISSVIGLCLLFAYKKKFIPALLSIMALLSTILCVFYTGCRGAYISLFVIIICLLMVLFKINRVCRKLAIAASVAGCSFIILHNGILQRLMSIFIMRGDSSTSFRMNVYNSAIQMFQDNPIWGIGVGNKVFREIYGLYMLSGFDALSCYCIYLEMAVESGIFSLIAFLMFLGSLLSESFKKYVSSSDNTEKIVLFTAFVSIIAVLIHGFVDTIYFRPQIQFVFWTMAAILTVMVRENKIAN